MKNEFLKLTDNDNSPVWINAMLVLTVETSHSKGSKIKMAMDDRVLKVKESPEQVLKLITESKKITL